MAQDVRSGGGSRRLQKQAGLIVLTLLDASASMDISIFSARAPAVVVASQWIGAHTPNALRGPSPL